ncbi:FG-GAP-like repeat-containing protein [Oceanidesulfovibrio marinus]|uniref:VCBS repeat-containing protein n=1 Tax=Oceanidesulfovibrio marinus TaxID=370038 RepID=A0A6P1ZKR8_9BACT|nr:FG-GAP-like repeat-containing protein [Oceanidesulfovibrio marinus]TVM35689.1 VCBS repeat-containing protein [Oceanidesulfovibrio marinus]
MQSHRTFRVALFVCSFLMLLSSPAWAKQDTFAVLPFAVNGPSEYAYLSEGIQDMLTTRLHWQDKFVSVDRSKLANLPSLKGLAEDKAAQLKSQLGVDYLFWGSATIMGDSMSIDLKSMGPEGAIQTRSASVKNDQLMQTLENFSKQINSALFQTGGQNMAQAPQGGGQQQNQVNAMNPGLVHNEINQNTQFYLNPQFRYAGDSSGSGRIRSSTLPYSANSMVIADGDGDGQQEIFIINDDEVHALRFDVENKLQPLASYKRSPSFRNIHINAYDVDGDGQQEIIVAAVRVSTKGKDNTYEVYDASSYILKYRDNKFTVLFDKIPFFINVVTRPPSYEPVLIGQKEGSRELFDTGVYEMIEAGGSFQLGPRLLLPKEANVFNFVYLPQEERYKIVVVDKDDKLRVYTNTGEQQSRSDKVYSGSGIGLTDQFEPIGIEDDLLLRDHYYVPLRMIPFNLDGDDRSELLVNHPVSVASMFFERYRHFPEGEIHALYWDGVGMNLVWKTRRIKGSVADLGLSDVNNDGIIDLAVLVNKHPGTLGMNKRRSLLLFYPLDTSSQNGLIDQGFRTDSE